MLLCCVVISRTFTAEICVWYWLHTTCCEPPGLLGSLRVQTKTCHPNRGSIPDGFSVWEIALSFKWWLVSPKKTRSTRSTQLITSRGHLAWGCYLTPAMLFEGPEVRRGTAGTSEKNFHELRWLPWKKLFLTFGKKREHHCCSSV